MRQETGWEARTLITDLGSALEVFGPELDRHGHGGCRSARRILPVPAGRAG
ncbi:MAG TPA: hypothetical protein VFX25_12670 [Streptosporangiaceae bacterium]|nr:hypothetical protein [Streptosporangiaceae bacterium]